MSHPLITRDELAEITRAAGALSMQFFRTLSDNAVEYKSEVDLVTHVDRTVQEFLINRLREIVPEAAFLAEEQEGPESLGTGPAFIIDPVDGTTNFVHGLPHFCVSVAYAEQARPRIGVVYAPALDEMFSGEVGKGSFCNGTPLCVSRTTNPRHALGCSGLFGADERMRRDSAELLGRTLAGLRDVRRLGAAALDLCFVAAGRFDLFWEGNLHAWDVAAGMVILEEAGGKLSDLQGATEDILDAGSVLAGTPPLHRWFLEQTSTFGLHRFPRVRPLQ